MEITDEELDLSIEFEQDLGDLILAASAVLDYLGTIMAKHESLYENLRYALEPFAVTINENIKAN